LWYILILTVTLFVFSSILYGSFTKTLYNDLDDLLSSRAEGVANSITAYWVAKDTAPAHDGLSSEDFSRNASDWVESKRKDPELMSIFVRILDSKGESVVASKSMPRIEELDKDVLEDALDGEDDFDTVKGEIAEGKKKAKFRVYTKPVMHDGRVEYLVQVTGPTSLLSLASQNLMWLLFVLLPLTVFLAATPALILVRLTLKPVDKMIDALKQTTAENLKLKIHIPDTKDEIRRLADTFNDLIERLDRSFSSQQGFIQDISAELKTPLRSLRAEFESAIANHLSTEEYGLILRQGLGEMDKFAHIIEELETLSRFDNNRVALEIRKVDLSPLVERSLDNVRPQACQKSIALSSFMREPVVIDGDERQLAAMFASILENAVKYTNRKGAVTISVRRDSKNAVVNISDTGIGIEENELPYIFDRFYQINKSRASNGSFGLGLSIAKSVAEVHKGAISVESKLGKGSTFTVSLPLSYPG